MPYVLTGAAKLPHAEFTDASLAAEGDYTVFYFTIPTNGRINIFVNADVDMFLYDSSEVLYPAPMRSVENAPFKKFQYYIDYQNPSVTDPVQLYLVVEALSDIGDFQVVSVLADDVGRYEKGASLVVDEIDIATRQNSGLLAMLQRGGHERTWECDVSESNFVIARYPRGIWKISVVVYDASDNATAIEGVYYGGRDGSSSPTNSEWVELHKTAISGTLSSATIKHVYLTNFAGGPYYSLLLYGAQGGRAAISMRPMGNFEDWPNHENMVWLSAINPEHGDAVAGGDLSRLHFYGDIF